MKKTLFTFWTALFFCAAIFGQSPYQLKTGKELALGGAALGLVGTSYYFGKKAEPLTIMQIDGLDQNKLSGFERWVTSKNSVSSHKSSDVLLYTSQLLPVALTLADKSMRKDAFTIGTLYSEATLLNYGLTVLVKNSVRRTRPYIYNQGTPLEKKMSLSARESFYSGHTSQTAAMCFLTASLYAGYHPDSKWKPVVWMAAATLPAVTGLLRMTSGKHFPTDVLTGYVTGAAIGLLVPRIHRRMQG